MVTCLSSETRPGGTIWQEHRYEIGQGMPLHRHKTWQLIVVLDGEIRFTDGTALETGQSVRIAPGEDHGYTATRPTNLFSVWGANP